jgi:hypothetical protein
MSDFCKNEIVDNEVAAKPELLLQDQLVPQAHSSGKIMKLM